MALQTSGTISLADIVGEFGGSAPHSLSEYYDAADGIPASGSISFSDFYGATDSTVVLAGKILVGDSGNYYFPSRGWWDQSASRGNVYDVVTFSPFPSNAAVVEIRETFGTGNPEQQNLNMYTGSDMRQYMTKIRIFGNGKDYVVTLDPSVNSFYDSGTGESMIRDDTNGRVMFTDDDLNKTYNFEIFS
jgi:hypothetical protein